MKFYAQSHVRNPSSMQHFVWLQPTQSLILHLSNELYPNAKIESSNANLKIFEYTSSDGKNRNEEEFMIVQSPDVSGWGNYSSCHLADIWVDSEQYSARLVVLLVGQTESKRDFITVINPDCNDIRLKPHSVLEVVLCDPRFDHQDEWVWEWTAGMGNVDLEQIGYQFLNVHTWKTYNHFLNEQPELPYSRCLRFNNTNNTSCRQHHFWFRFQPSMSQTMELKSGIERVGNIRFYGYANRLNKQELMVEYFLTLHVNFSKADRAKMAEINILKPLAKYTCPSPIGPKPKFPINNHIKKSKIVIPLVRDVQIEPSKAKTLEEGCNTFPAVLDSILKPTQFTFMPKSHMMFPPSKRMMNVDDYNEYHEWQY